MPDEPPFDWRSSKEAKVADAPHHWLWGPGCLGGTIGLVVNTTLLLAYYVIWEPAWTRGLWCFCCWILATGYLGGMIAGSTARDEFLRPDWAKHRTLVALLHGVAMGMGVGLIFVDIRVAVAGGMGAAVGGFIDALVYRDTLESDW